MHSYFTIISLVAGICLGFGILYLVVGLRRKADKPLSFTFALFAFFYAITLINGIRWYAATNVSEYIAINRFDAIFVAGVFIALIWHISYYSGYRPRIFLWLLSAVLILPSLVYIISPATFTGEVSDLTYIILPWGEKLVNLELTGSVWYDLVQLIRFVTLGYIIVALIIQYRHDERQPAMIMGLGLLPFIVGIVYEIFGEIGFVPYIPLGEIGFVGIAIAASLQMAVSVIKTEEELELHRNNLEGMIEERTAKLKTQINERELAEAALYQSERTARALLDAPPESTILVTRDGVVLDSNQIGARRLGHDSEDIIGQNVFDLFDPEVSKTRRHKAAEILNNKQPLQWEDQRSGNYYSNRMYPILDDQGEIESIAVFASDITELKHAQEASKELAVMEERNRLARDLHDAVTQTIYSATLIVEALPQVWERSPDEGMRNLGKLRALVRGALAEMRTLLIELRPSALEGADLDTLLHQLGDALTGRTRIPAKVEIKMEGELSREVKITFYRIAQEALNNIAKHSKATQAWISLLDRGNRVDLEIRDNGQGFDPQDILPDRMGLRIMEERCDSINARMNLNSTPCEGTRLTVTWVDGEVENRDEWE